MMLTTGSSNSVNEIKWAVMKNWSEENIGSAAYDTSPKLIGASSQFETASQTQVINLLSLTRVAEGWGLINAYLWDPLFNLLPESAFDFTSFFEKCFLPFNKEVINFCLKNNILNECLRYYKIFKETFNNVNEITVNVSHDYELEDYSKINFVLTISDEIEAVLKYENEFKLRIRKEIDREKRHHFTFNYNLI